MSSLTSPFRMRDIDIQGWEPSSSSSIDADANVIPTSAFLSAQHIPSLGRSALGSTKAQAASHPFNHTTESSEPSNIIQALPPAPSSLPPFSRPASITSPPSSRGPAAAGRMPQRARTSTERKIARKLAENAAYVPRPRNSFIIFRTDFVAYRMSTDSVRPPKMSPSTYDALTELLASNEAKGRSKKGEVEGTLSKQASGVWNRLAESQRRPWTERAEKEKTLHAQRHPEYRYKPARHGPLSISSQKPNESRNRSPSTASQPVSAPSPASAPRQHVLSLPSVPPIPSFAASSCASFSAQHSTTSITVSPSPPSPVSFHEAAESPVSFVPYQSFSVAAWPSEVHGNLSIVPVTETASWASSVRSPAALSLPDCLVTQSFDRSVSQEVLSSSVLSSGDASDCNRDIEETIDMGIDIDMHSLFASSQAPTPSEACTNSASAGQSDGASPLEAIANLWIHDKDRLEKACGSLSSSRPHIVSPDDTALTSAEPSIYSLDNFSLPCFSDSNGYAAFNGSDNLFSTYDDFGLNLDAELIHAGYEDDEHTISASALSFSTLGRGCSPIRPPFALGYDQRGAEIAVEQFYGKFP